VAGTGRLLEGIANFRFGDAELKFLERTKVVNAQTLEYLASYRFSGDIWGYPEGEAYFPNSPILIVEATFAEACMLETYLLSVLNHDSAIA
jgi:nicotinate phosphoribosyltransferase